ncbi:hypothetical protein JAAARDRAFT_65200 [Jaapia argillacea MUCL 33604]|uniref:Methyltransferase type 11 domain-containing protein n=1 Tax=Jaapia argillacea MUCL 33604 TaxID=933084 RepID=A0A067QKG6_9AGAM|nr:hypothetical protein JAAARDRAFT_65200 [Jaapia argillacea MUCL 33604]
MSTNSFAQPTFSAENYRAYRPRYPDRLYTDILEYHDSHGGKRGSALDLGCGPGTVTESLTAFFDKVVGVDPGQGMVDVATKLAKTLTLEGKSLEYVVGSAEDIPASDSSVDLITSGTSAHWFPANWWQSAARVLRPGGTVAIFTYGRPFVPSHVHPEAAKITERISSWRSDPDIAPHIQEGNKVAEHLFDDLPLPDPNSGEWGGVERRVWNRDGHDENQEPYMTAKATLSALKASSATSGPTYRWRQANPDKVGTDQDPLERHTKELKEISGWTDDQVVEIGMAFVLIMVKRL